MTTVADVFEYFLLHDARMTFMEYEIGWYTEYECTILYALLALADD